ncbi:MAG: zinc ribbon domain-containing protein [Pyrinomonadaceae bacterium]
MALLNCPECGREVSDSAIACPNCGRPIDPVRPVIERNVVQAAPPAETSGLPPWIWAPIVLIGAAVLIGIIMITRHNEEDPANTRVRVEMESANSKTPERSTDPSGLRANSIPNSMAAGSTPDSQVNVHGTQTDVSTEPQTGSAAIEAKTVSGDGDFTPVKNERFYLMDKDVETILSEADLDPIDGQSLTNSFGLAVADPGKYGDFQRKALSAFKEHIKYSGTTDATGKVKLDGIKPDDYYIFGVAKTGKGFAIWSSPVSINAGDNNLNLAPQRETEIDKPTN